MPLAGHKSTQFFKMKQQDERSSNGESGKAPETKLFQHSWPEISKQHDIMLSSHLEMLHQLKSQVHSHGEEFQLVSNMVDKTKRLIAQFEILKKRVVPKLNTAKPESDTHSSESMSTSSSRKELKKEQLKRHADHMYDPEEDGGAAAAENQDPLTARSLAVHSSKRKRIDEIIPGADEDLRRFSPVSVETEDISEEVQRRLKIKEEQRRRRETSKVDKRKRDSLTSNGSTSSARTGTKHTRKKARTGTKWNR
ncbi:hypothetical protein BO83DRAFT_436968 [Aspergillus eucalypticola CBS 122712]|uniref:Uncharacterized protein n=1 Tax=Aspergillus eucalypticola (strain CBS 122712 / IBT 29274) TaxID=1448314 RepID=A0A317VM63_ASPEC|nr:uncharacterized protein BO83DRAFT_436968 [Aspergillus eucalypticola CBS 122712]PWY74965.1 hypothetical protein BO83DRAFT_436968 [Aspergillus eucalypticola CBS 122712]